MRAFHSRRPRESVSSQRAGSRAGRRRGGVGDGRSRRRLLTVHWAADGRRRAHGETSARNRPGPRERARRRRRRRRQDGRVADATPPAASRSTARTGRDARASLREPVWTLEERVRAHAREVDRRRVDGVRKTAAEANRLGFVHPLTGPDPTRRVRPRRNISRVASVFERSTGRAAAAAGGTRCLSRRARHRGEKKITSSFENNVHFGPFVRRISNVTRCERTRRDGGRGSTSGVPGDPARRRNNVPSCARVVGRRARAPRPLLNDSARYGSSVHVAHDAVFVRLVLAGDEVNNVRLIETYAIALCVQCDHYWPSGRTPVFDEILPYLWNENFFQI